ncbi:hypothetical protein ACS0TY_025853 [Phlomoides rotata]
MTGPNDDTLLLCATLIHMLTIKRNSSNYLLWRSQLLLLLTRKGLIDLVDGTPPASSIEITEKVMSFVVSCTTAGSVWLALKSTFCHHSKVREL